MEEKEKILHELSDIICRALRDANEKVRNAGGKLGAGDLDYLDKLTHTMKSIKTTLAMMESEEDDGYSQRYSNRGRSMRRDSMGRYSREDGYSYHDGLEDMISDLSEDKKREVQRYIERMGRM